MAACCLPLAVKMRQEPGETLCATAHTEADHELCSLDLRSGILTSLLSHPDDMLYGEEGEEEGEGWEDPNVPAAVGRPRTVINLQYVIHLRSEGFIWKHIRMLLGNIPKTTFNRWRLNQRFEEHDPLVETCNWIDDSSSVRMRAVATVASLGVRSRLRHILMAYTNATSYYASDCRIY